MPSLAELRTELDEARERLLAQVRTASHEAFTRRPPGEPTPEDERWPIRDVLWHVLNTEHRWRLWIEQELGGPPMGTSARSPRPAAIETVQDLLSAFDAERTKTLAVVERLHDLGDEVVDRVRTAPRDYVHSIREALGHLVEHDRLHLEQVRELLQLR